jgi:hypothetical protein
MTKEKRSRIEGLMLKPGHIPLFLPHVNYVIGKKGLSCSKGKYIPFFLLQFNYEIGKKGLSCSKGKYIPSSSSNSTMR